MEVSAVIIVDLSNGSTLSHLWGKKKKREEMKVSTLKALNSKCQSNLPNCEERCRVSHRTEKYLENFSALISTSGKSKPSRNNSGFPSILRRKRSYSSSRLCDSGGSGKELLWCTADFKLQTLSLFSASSGDNSRSRFTQFITSFLQVMAKKLWQQLNNCNIMKK